MKKRRVLLILCFVVLFLIWIYGWRTLLLIRDLGYLTRPIWDAPLDAPTAVLPHFHSGALPLPELCRLHNWTFLERPRRVIDAFLFSVELDLLEIRFRELWNVV